MADKKYYWLRLHKDFFKRHEIRIIEAMPNGKDYVLFYLKLLVESVSHEGNLRFSDTVPYSMEMLSVLTNTNVDVVKSAIEVFTELKMIDIMDDATIFMSEVDTMIGSAQMDEQQRESARLRKQKQRAREKALLESPKCDSHVTCHGEIRDKSIDINNICSSEDERKPKSYTDEPEYQDFLKIYEIYPKKVGKQSAYTIYKKWITGKKKIDKHSYKLSNKQIWEAVNNYVKWNEKKNTDLTYYCNFDTLMNNLLNWVIEEKE